MEKTKTTAYSFDLPEELIALYPCEPRDHCRLLAVDRKKKSFEEKIFYQILDYLNAGDVLVFNNTKVDKSRTYARKKTGGKFEIFFLEHLYLDKKKCKIMDNKTKRLPVGTLLFLPDKIEGVIQENRGEGILILETNLPITEAFLEKNAEIPLPPYIRKKRNYEKKDEILYQTVFGEKEGSKASPTAGLHFTKELLEKIKNKGVEIVFIQHFVSLGTFEPIKTEYIEDHPIHTEEFYIPEESAQKINQAIHEKRRIIAVGTTVVRSLESAYEKGNIKSGRQKTSLFIYPGYHFQVIDAMITNFHTPNSTLLALVAAFMGYEFLFQVYDYAIQKKMRFFSYGDAMFIY